MTLHDMLFWGFLSISSALPVFIALAMWMVIATRSHKVAELIQKNEPLGTSIYVAKFTAITLLILIVLYTMNYVAIGGLSADPIPMSLHICMATLPLIISCSMGVVLVLLARVVAD